MIISDDKLIMDKYVSFLKKHFDIYVYAHGNDKVSLILKINTDYIKLDVFRTSKEYQHAMLLYAIGSKKFNIKMRSAAKRKGYILNQYGLYKLESLNKPIHVNSEKDFFTILNIPYVSYDKR
jgi:DNA polymerase/3'-5' exonuclease PolX